jgi:hypothetical protein
MIQREAGIQELYERLKLAYVEIGLKTFKRNPTQRLRDEDFPYIILDQGTDQIVKAGSRKTHGYPAKRVAEIILEIGTNDDGKTNIQALYDKVRKAIFTVRGSDPVEYSATLVRQDGVFFAENRTEGPTGVDIPDILVMRLVLDLIYNDKAFLS